MISDKWADGSTCRIDPASEPVHEEARDKLECEKGECNPELRWERTRGTLVPCSTDATGEPGGLANDTGEPDSLDPSSDRVRDDDRFCAIASLIMPGVGLPDRAHVAIASLSPTLLSLDQLQGTQLFGAGPPGPS
jgi:hypothetical protein